MNSTNNPQPGYQPHMSDEQADRIHAWHEAAYQGDAHDTEVTVTCLDREFVVPPEVHPPQGTSDMLGQAVLDEVRETDRVLDMGTGSGINAILAASKSSKVVAVDVNPVAVQCARANAKRNGVADRIDAHESDVFDHVDGKFDLIIFDPPFRWFRPRDLRERGTADENYSALTIFFGQVKEHLSPEGRVLMFFGTSGDIDYLYQLIDDTGFRRQILATRDFERDGHKVNYYAFKLVA